MSIVLEPDDDEPMLAHLPIFPSSSSRPLNAAPPPVAPKPDTAPELPIFTAINDELKDVRRVATHGQEEDLRTALGRVISRVEELSNLLRTAYRTHTDLETSLGVARSNLALVQANNEMLEEALKRGDMGGSGQLSKDIGWRRWSAREGQQRVLKIEEEGRPRSMDGAPSAAGSPQPSSSPSSSSSDHNSVTTNATTTAIATTQSTPPSTSNPPSPSQATTTPLNSPSPVIPPTPPASQESRFFRSFRFSGGGSGMGGSWSGSSTPVGRRSRSPVRSAASDGSGVTAMAMTHLNSSSLPSLLSKDSDADKEREKEKEKEHEKAREAEKEREKRLEELAMELEKEKEAKVKANSEKAALEAELESLSQALFEEANKMVAQERIKRAETEEELREARMEKEALKSALKVVEGENGRLRRGSLIYPDVRGDVKEGEGGDGTSDEPTEVDGDHEGMLSADPLETAPPESRSSSRMGMKSPVHSTRSSIMELKTAEDVPTPTHAPAPVANHEPSSSISSTSLPSDPQSQAPSQAHTCLPPLSVSPNRNSSSSLSLDGDNEVYTTPMSRSQSQLLVYPNSQPQSRSDIDTEQSSSASHTLPISIPEHEHELQHDKHKHDLQQHKDDEEHQLRNTDTLMAMPLPSDTSATTTSSSSTYFSPPNPIFQLSSPGMSLVDEPSPWA